MIDLSKVIFSSKGSYVGIFKEAKHVGGGLWLRSLIQPEWGTGRKKVTTQILKIIPFVEKKFVNYDLECLPEALKIISKEGEAVIVISNSHTVKFTLKNMDIVLEHDHQEQFATNFKLTNKSVSGFYPLSNTTFEIKLKSGNLAYEKNLKRIIIENCTLFTITVKRSDIEYIDENTSYKEIEIKQSYEAFCKSIDLDCEQEKLASYVLWSGSYSPLGNIKNWCNPISKLKMNMFFSWSNCFIAVGLMKNDKALAKENFLSILNYQKDSGFIYDAINPVLKVGWFTKPPIYGYFYKKLTSLGMEFSKNEKTDLLAMMKRLLNAWMKNESAVKLCRYTHPWDSGMDNASCFDGILPLSTPELNTYIIELLDAIVILSNELGNLDDVTKYKKIQKNYINNFLKLAWDGKQFNSVDDFGNALNISTACKFVPFILSDKLPPEIIKAMYVDLTNGQYLTKWSVASESLDSIKYDTRQGDTLKPGAYWRGPIWAYFAYIISDGLKSCKIDILADKIKSNFCDVVELNQGGIYENYDALSGEGYDDSCDQWTAAVYLHFKSK